MQFINPKTDFAFKKIFGSSESKDILISFLNAIIYGEKPSIVDLEIINPYLAPKIRGVKDTYLDVRAKLSDGTIVIIEMQVLNIEGFEKRILYNAAKAYSIQLGRGEYYTLLNPVIALTITDFIMFKTIEQVITKFVLKEKEYLIDYPIDDLELVFVELPKFEKGEEELEGLCDKWIYFIKKARDLSAIPKSMQGIPELKRAFEIANESNLTQEELEDLEHREIFIHDQRNAIKKALKQGIEQGLKKGRQEGENAKALEIARNLIDILDPETISKKTGLTLEEIEELT